MRSANFLKPNATIGLIAPSFGCQDEPYKSRLDQAIKTFEGLGYKLKYSDSIFINHGLESVPAKMRANEFMQMWLDDEVDFIFSVAGGEVMLEILPYIDFDKLKNTPSKFFMGFSDNTNLTFTLPTLAGAPALYGPNFPSFGSSSWEEYIIQTHDFLTGKANPQHSFEYYQEGKNNTEEGHYLDPLNPTIPSSWKSLDERRTCFLEGRFIGGCLDVIMNIIGSRFDNVKDFINKHEDEGIIWFLEACDLNILSQYRALLQLKEGGYFKNCKGIVLGRPLIREPLYDTEYEFLLKKALNDLGVPVIYDIDIGHVPPSLTVVSGSYSRLEYRDGKGTIEFLHF